MLFVHSVFVVAFCSSICNYFHVLLIHLVFVVVFCSSIWNCFGCYSSIWSFLSRSVRPFENYFRPLFVRFCWVFCRWLLVRSSRPLDSRRPQVLLSCSALAHLSLSPLSLSVSIAVARIFGPSGYDVHKEEECHLKLRDTEKEREK